MTEEYLALLMFLCTLAALMLGFPVALTLGGMAIIFAFIGDYLELFNWGLLNIYPLRILGIMKTETLVAVPLFIFMGLMLDKSKLAGNLLEAMAGLFGKRRGGLGISVLLVGTLLAASTGIVGATIVTMGLMSYPVMLRAGYDPKLAAGLICSSGTLGQIIPPSIILVLLADILQGANEQAAELSGILVPEPVTAIDLFAGALIPGLFLVTLYMLWLIIVSKTNPNSCPPVANPSKLKEATEGQSQNTGTALISDLVKVIFPPLCLMFLVLGSILAGIATPTESAAVGAVGATLLAFQAGRLTFNIVKEVSRETTRMSSMVFLILLGASLFSLVFRGFGGDSVIEEFLQNLPGGAFTAMLLVMLVIFLLGFFLDFLEIIFVVVPIIAPTLIALGYNPLWLGVMIGVNLQTSFLTPPFGFALFYLRGVAPKEVRTSDIYKGVMPFILLQLIALAIFWIFPEIVTWLPSVIL